MAVIGRLPCGGCKVKWLSSPAYRQDRDRLDLSHLGSAYHQNIRTLPLAFMVPLQVDSWNNPKYNARIQEEHESRIGLE